MSIRPGVGADCLAEDPLQVGMRTGVPILHRLRGCGLSVGTIQANPDNPLWSGNPFDELILVTIHQSQNLMVNVRSLLTYPTQFAEF